MSERAWLWAAAALACACGGAEDPRALRRARGVDSLELSVLSTLAAPKAAVDVAIAGDTAFVIDEEAGLLVVDITDRGAPVYQGSYGIRDLSHGLACDADRDLCYVADGQAGLQVVTVADPLAPANTGHLDTPGYAHSVTAEGDVVYIADAAGGLHIVNASDPANPAKLGRVRTPGTEGWAKAVAVHGGWAYIADGNAGVAVVNVSDPTAPKVTGLLRTPGTAVDIWRDERGGWVYVADTNVGVHIIDVSDPTNPVLKRTLGGEVLVEDPDGVGGYYGRSKGNQGSVVYLFVACGVLGLKIFDVTDPADPSPSGALEWAGCDAHDVLPLRGYAYVADKAQGLVVVDIADILPLVLPPAPTRAPATLVPPGGAPLPVSTAVAATGTPRVTAGPIANTTTAAPSGPPVQVGTFRPVIMPPRAPWEDAPSTPAEDVTPSLTVPAEDGANSTATRAPIEGDSDGFNFKCNKTCIIIAAASLGGVLCCALLVAVAWRAWWQRRRGGLKRRGSAQWREIMGGDTQSYVDSEAPWGAADHLERSTELTSRNAVAAGVGRRGGNASPRSARSQGNLSAMSGDSSSGRGAGRGGGFARSDASPKSTPPGATEITLRAVTDPLDSSAPPTPTSRGGARPTGPPTFAGSRRLSGSTLMTSHSHSTFGNGIPRRGSGAFTPGTTTVAAAAAPTYKRGYAPSHRMSATPTPNNTTLNSSTLSASGVSRPPSQIRRASTHRKQPAPQGAGAGNHGKAQVALEI